MPDKEELTQVLIEDDDAFADALSEVASASALLKAAKTVTDTRGETLRAAVDAAARHRFEAKGETKWRIKVGDKPVGTYTVAVAKETEEKVSTTIQMDEPSKFELWLRTDGIEEVMLYARSHAEEFARFVLAKTGEIPSGFKTVEVRTPAMPERFKNGIVKVDERKVFEAYDGRLPQSVAGYMEKGE
jgi:hypothetical protein